jgi:hypothetical protein
MTAAPVPPAVFSWAKERRKNQKAHDLMEIMG